VTEKGDKEVKPGHLWFRRHVLVYGGWAGLGLCACAGTGALVRFGYPRVLFEPPTEFIAGWPEEYRVGEVSTRWIPSHRVWVIREKKGFYALYASCTHLGCTPGWVPAEGKFKCFCHGSGFHVDGINFEGPAPRPLPAVRPQPRVSSAFDDEPEADPDQERIEIPAFLRRQAN
jgi:cytochrome b6-f complex iron-sulfur subunit